MPQAIKMACEIINNSYSSAIGMRPRDVTRQNAALVLNYKERKRAKKEAAWLKRQLGQRRSIAGLTLPYDRRLPVGTRVRVSVSALEPTTPGGAFQKQLARPTFSSQVWRISGYKASSPIPSYTVSAIPATPGETGYTLPFSFTRSQLLVINGADAE